LAASVLVIIVPSGYCRRRERGPVQARQTVQKDVKLDKRRAGGDTVADKLARYLLGLEGLLSNRRQIDP
jgi:hypothetical protein